MDGTGGLSMVLDRYKCDSCGKVFYECQLVRTKCSENYVGSYIQRVCPKCITKRPPRYGRLKKMKDGSK